MNHRQNQEGAEGRKTLRVFGEGTISATPDQVQMRLGVITQNESITIGQQENAEAIAAVIAAIQELNVQENQIQTVVYRIDPQYDYIEGVEVFRGYRIVHLLQITLDQVGIAGPVIDAAVNSGANSIASIQFTLEDPTTVYNQALAQAVDNARSKAATLARSLNVTLNPVPLEVKEVAKGLIPERYPTVLAAQTTPTPIQPGQLIYEVTIEVLFTYF
ncbi:SIMPL domain-containing protein [Halalkalibacter alkalisediminis]|uniref:SIMPL domain-containing protein n=1 Tax=Halalkalibacter alkalisediminis TaxID=935616 RepID=A0ABV6NG85_9BACI|nr:SIMPL domain-containing protein [Halalkalibacter alkalisediminis]